MMPPLVLPEFSSAEAVAAVPLVPPTKVTVGAEV